MKTHAARLRSWPARALARGAVSVLALALAVAVVACGSVTANRPPVPTRTPTPTATPTPLPHNPALIVRDAHLATADGQSATLIGVSHSSLEYSCQGDGHFALADFQAMRGWGMNVVRFPLWSRFWLNADGSCPTYQQTVLAAVRAAEAAHLYVILDLQWSLALAKPAYTDSNGYANYQYPMPDTGEAVQFWRAVAAQYRDDPNVLFDIYGEPNAVSWDVWYNGGTITMPAGSYQAIGMRGLVDVVRGIAPSNVIIVSGINWGYDLQEVGTTYTFPESNLLFGTHPFNYSNKQPWDFDRAFGEGAGGRFAAIGTEFGSYDCQTGYIASVIAYFNQHHMSWLAWSWSASGCGTPSLLSKLDAGVPSQPYGAYIRQQMLALHVVG
jgi:endoglucanase